MPSKKKPTPTRKQLLQVPHRAARNRAAMVAELRSPLGDLRALDLMSDGKLADAIEAGTWPPRRQGGSE
jgi:hypothetical protein